MTQAGEPVDEPASELVTAARSLLGAGVEQLAGGYSGETFLADVAGEQVVMRLYLRQPERAGIDAALLSLVGDLVPVPRVLQVRATPMTGMPAHLVSERLDGQRLDLVLSHAPVEVRRHAGRQVGHILARLSGVPFLRGGFFADDTLTVAPWPPAARSLADWVAEHREAEAFTRWSASDFDALVDLTDDAQRLLDAHVRRVCLVHGDVNPKNILVDPGSGTVTGLVDWEFAHAGLPYGDLGNLLRFETDEVFCAAVVETFCRDAPAVEPASITVELARCADLFALVDLGARGEENAVTSQAHALLRAMVRAGDVTAGRMAWPSGVSPA